MDERPDIQGRAHSIGSALICALRMKGAEGHRISAYKAPNYWLDYRFGFVRRGLPGEILRRAIGGPPTYRQVEATAVVLSRAAASALVPAAFRVARLSPERTSRAAATALLLLSPLTESLLLHDVGRYDAIGVLTLGLLEAQSNWPSMPLSAQAALIATVSTLATASEEVLFPLIAPTVVAALISLSRRQKLSRRHRTLLLVVAVGPSAVVAGASLLLPAPQGALASAREEALRAGVAPGGAMGDCLDALDRNIVENVSFFRLFRPAALAASIALWASLYAATVRTLGQLVGISTNPTYVLIVAIHAVMAGALSALAVDFRRWWGLALMGVIATLSLSDLQPSDPPPTRKTLGRAVLLAVGGLGLRNLNVYPVGGVVPERTLRTA